MLPEGFLILERVRLGYTASSKKRMLQEMGELLASPQPGLEENDVFDRLLERERLGSTGMGQGIALPHARMDGIGQARGAFLQLQGPIDYDAVDRMPVDLAFGLLVPQEATQEHLNLLATLAGLFRDPQFCMTLREASRPAEVLQLFLARAEAAPPGP